MKTVLKLIFLLFITLLLVWVLRDYNNTPLVAKDLSNVNEKSNHLFVFVGEKLAFTELPYDKESMSVGFKVKYKVLERVYGNFPEEKVELLVHDDFNIQAFSKYKDVLLFVFENKGEYRLDKFHFSDVYKTKNGKWAGSYAAYDYNHPYNKNTSVKPEIIDFVNNVSYPTKNEDGFGSRLNYPSPYYRMAGDTAFAIYGNYIEDLFKLKKEGVLTEKELFGEAYKKDRELKAEQGQLKESKITYNLNGLKFIDFCRSFLESILTHDIKEFKNRSLQNLQICDSFLAVDRFVKERFDNLFDSVFISKIIESRDVHCAWTEAYNSDISLIGKREMIQEGDSYIFRQIRMDVINKENIFCRLYLNFIATKQGYKFYGCSYFGNGHCCH